MKFRLKFSINNFSIFSFQNTFPCCWLSGLTLAGQVVSFYLMGRKIGSRRNTYNHHKDELLLKKNTGQLIQPSRKEINVRILMRYHANRLIVETHLMSGTMLTALYYFIFRWILEVTTIVNHFVRKMRDRGQVTCLRSHEWWVEPYGLNPCPCDSNTHSFNTCQGVFQEWWGSFQLPLLRHYKQKL